MHLAVHVFSISRRDPLARLKHYNYKRKKPNRKRLLLEQLTRLITFDLAMLTASISFWNYLIRGHPVLIGQAADTADYTFWVSLLSLNSSMSSMNFCLIGLGNISLPDEMHRMVLLIPI